MSDSFFRHKKEIIKKVFTILGSDFTEENFISTPIYNVEEYLVDCLESVRRNISEIEAEVCC